MSLIYTLAGVGMMIAGLLYLINSARSATKVASGEEKPAAATGNIVAGFLILVSLVIFVLQIWGAIGQGSQADNPFILNWLQGIYEGIAAGTLPQLK